MPFNGGFQLTHKIRPWIVPALSQELALLGLHSRLVDDVQGKLKWNLFVWPCAVKQRNRRLECFKIQKVQRVLQSFQEGLDLGCLDERFPTDCHFPLNLLLRR